MGGTMKKKHTKGIGLIIVIVAISSLVAIYFIQQNKARETFARNIFELGPHDAPPQTIEELKQAIVTYEKQIDQQVQAAGKVGLYWKLLATKYMDKKMYGEAMDALKQAIYYYPEDPSLHYLFGLSSSILAKSSYGKERDQLFAQAEKAHLRAVELDDRYTRPRYALGVLYVFELNKPEQAIPHLEKLLTIDTKDVDAMFVLARAYYMLEEYDKAVKLYDTIIQTTTVSTKRTEAENNKKQILEMIYE
jgi:tetratricopeptide (TPR) repeat protein